MKYQTSLSLSLLALLCLLAVSSTGCGGGATASSTPPEPIEPGIPYKKFTDAVHAVMMADRTVYASKVVTRLKKQDAPVTPSEYWEDEDHTIPLPAQMFRMGSELVFENPEAGFTYALKSKWPLNEQNGPKSEFETKALDFLAENPDENFYGEETLGGDKFFVAAYADKAVAEACWSCHNDHGNREDHYPEFAKDDVMGGVIVRVPIK
ncbi:Tll0287-like domain-containing protein [Aporhodopirellula aestuarii]|uniref:DUF3365 domain-containing protein n=1 Tax=Aporhodopirellula aestuarii TaxID=2950107 RepID=A0ABT0TY90_9BACT|nr:DUF3365 domain-containing protein [Aporhodopirellula aestuarii]MCM2369567.1 DUF3365 domain-containing protein [Aporhodopirellula aestuarii]